MLKLRSILQRIFLFPLVTNLKSEKAHNLISKIKGSNFNFAFRKKVVLTGPMVIF
jgi:hypothetical protein